MSRYIPNTDEQQQSMLKELGMEAIDELFKGIPESVRMKRKLDLPEAMAELELLTHMNRLASNNRNLDEYTGFLGAGAYDHFIPSIVGHMLSRQEFYTAYTPYQPEISQGTLQAIFEYQTMICELTGMEVANASMYDGASALAEAASMSCNATCRKEIIVAGSVHPAYREVLRTYSKFYGSRIFETGYDNGTVKISDIESRLSSDTAAVIIQNPNFFGLLEDIEQLEKLVHGKGALLVVSVDPISLAILKPPGESGADIVVGEGQSLGSPVSFGGPYLGFFAASKGLLRKMPGRIVGQTTDDAGNRGFVLTMQAREQHIRREKATSNICSNQALNALAATIYLTVLGKQGLRDVAMLCLQKAHYAFEQLIATGVFEPCFAGPFFKEFAVRCCMPVEKLNEELLSSKIIGGYKLEKDYPELAGCWLIAVTEKRSRMEIDNFVEKASKIIERWGRRAI